MSISDPTSEPQQDSQHLAPPSVGGLGKGRLGSETTAGEAGLDEMEEEALVWNDSPEYVWAFNSEGYPGQ